MGAEALYITAGHGAVPATRPRGAALFSRKGHMQELLSQEARKYTLCEWGSRDARVAGLTRPQTRFNLCLQVDGDRPYAAVGVAHDGV
eukprot:350811-Chlamydomonas_euryale.AAC.4